jgi:hypothetical protein
MASLELIELRCPSCGGDLRYTPGAPVASCPYCSATIALVSTQSGRPVSLDGADHRLVRFATTEADFKRALLAFLAEGDFTPDDVFDQVQVRQQTGLFAATFLYEGTARVHWTASAGFQRRESYVEDHVEVENGRRVNRPRTATRTVTDWRPISGESLQDYRLCVVATPALPAELHPLIETVEGLAPTDALPPVDPAAVKGFAIEPFAGSPEENFQRVAQGRLNAELLRLTQKRIPGDEHKQLSLTSTRAHERCTRLYRPIWFATYAYKGQRFSYAMDGVSKKGQGTRPEDHALRDSVQRLEKELSNANVLAIVAAVLLFFVLTIFGPILAGVGWYFYTQGPKRRLAELRAQIAASKARRSRFAQAGLGA